MIDLSQTTAPKSDQLNADDLIAGSMQIKVTSVKIIGGDQPVHIYYDGDNGKPWKPCKSMCRAMILAWGKNGEDYVGRSMVLFRDKTVKWAGKEEGGIRISHMSDIKDKIRMMLTVSRGKRTPFIIEVLKVFAGNPLPPADLELWQQNIEAAATMADLSAIGAQIKTNNYDESGSDALKVHYQAAVDRIRSTENTLGVEYEDDHPEHLETARKHFHATGVEIYGKEWDTVRGNICKAEGVESSKNFSAVDIARVIQNMKTQ